MSAERISLPGFDTEELQKLIVALASLDGPKWLPKHNTGKFLYIRPTIIGSNAQLGLQPPGEAMLYIILGYMGPAGTPVGGKRVVTSPRDMVRSWVGGIGFAKVGANYGPTVIASQEAARQGFHQVLWLYGEEGECTEAGGSNFFVVWKRKDGRKELITAPLDDRLILDGVTRRSCLELARERLGGEIEITERKFTIHEVMEAAAEDRLLESFSAGTAVSCYCFYVTNHVEYSDIACSGSFAPSRRSDTGKPTLTSRWEQMADRARLQASSRAGCTISCMGARRMSGGWLCPNVHRYRMLNLDRE